MYKLIFLFSLSYFLSSCISSKIQVKNKDKLTFELEGFGKQELQKDVFFYDKDKDLYKIELKYWDKKERSSLYFVARGGYLDMMKQRNYSHGDTLIIEEIYFSMEEFSPIDNTLLEQRKTLTIEFDAFIKDETKRMYFVGDQLVNIKYFGRDDKIYGGTKNTYSDTELTSISWQYKLDGQYNHYASGKITWNQDKTKITRVNNRHDWEEVYHSYYTISKNTEHYHNKDSSSVSSIIFIENKDFFGNFLLRKIGYDDAMFGIHLLKTSLYKKAEERRTRDGKTTVYTYDYKTNKKGQILIEQKFKNDKLTYNAEYSYY